MNKVIMLVENIEKPIIIDLKIFKNPDEYWVFNKNSLFKHIPEKLKNIFIERGLYKNKDSGLNSNDSLASVHRLVACLYDNILDKEIHHIRKDKNLNDITSIVPLDSTTNKKIESFSAEARLQESLKIQQKWISTIAKSKRQTLVGNSNLNLEILKLSINTKAKDIIKSFKTKIKKSSIYMLLSFYLYKSTFIDWLEASANKEATEINGKFKERWENILKFESMKMQYTH